MKITFKAKIHNVVNADGSLAWRFVHFPKLKRSHVDMAQARMHPVYGAFANSDLFENCLSKIRHDILKADWHNELRLDRLPDNVSVDESGFLAKVTIMA